MYAPVLQRTANGFLRTTTLPVLLKPKARSSLKFVSSRSAVRMAATSSDKGITLYSFSTPNGFKASVTLEEIGVPYKLETINIGSNVQKEDWFLKINPNGRIPALVDHDAGDLAVFESGALMMYAADKFDSDLLPKEAKARYEVLSWLMFQMGGIGPMQGQINYFARFGAKSPVATKRFVTEVKRLYSVLESRLKDHSYLVGDKYSLADIANFCWVLYGPFAGIDWNDYPGLKAWVKKIAERPAVQKGLKMPPSSPTSAFGKVLDAVADDSVYAEILKSSKEIVEANWES